MLKGIVCMPSNLHYNCFVFDNNCDYLNLKKNCILFHDGLQNGGCIIEIKDSISNLIKNNFCYIFIIAKK